ncbi:MAG: hypothetical protein ACRDJN_17260 [Chloroflexota bacterium]
MAADGSAGLAVGYDGPMRDIEPDAGELLVQALDLAIGGVTLARYAAAHTADARLRRLFRQFAATSEQQERVLRQQLAAYAAESSRSAGGRTMAAVAVGAAGLMAILAAVFLAARATGKGWGRGATPSGRSGAGLPGR